MGILQNENNMLATSNSFKHEPIFTLIITGIMVDDNLADSQ